MGASEAKHRKVDKQDRTARLQEAPRSDRLLSWDEISPWQRDNNYILTGYRRASYSYTISLKSILQVHNESANIWTHLLGAALFGLLLWQFQLEIAPQLLHATLSDCIAVVVFYLAVMACFSLSTTFHTFSDHSPAMHRFGNELDHLGIVLVIWGSGIPSDYFGFYCEVGMRNFYWTLASITALGSAVFTLQPDFRKYRTTRFLMYCVLGASLFVPVIHSIALNGWETQNIRMSLKYFFGLGILNFSGAAIYTARIPERWFPGRFDIFGSSHQIMHVLVVCGALSHLTGLLKALEYWTTLKMEYGDACLVIQ